MPKLLRIFANVARTLAFAHSRNVIHLDLKPGNVMVGEFGEVYVMDWGWLDSRTAQKPTCSIRP